eukprot:459232-Hanusia_phi.AAC.1
MATRPRDAMIRPDRSQPPGTRKCGAGRLPGDYGPITDSVGVTRGRVDSPSAAPRAATPGAAAAAAGRCSADFRRDEFPRPL